MFTRVMSPALLAFVLMPAFASDPGQPLDCSDWVPLMPGYTCIAAPHLPFPGLPWIGHDAEMDNQGGMLVAQMVDPTGSPRCGPDVNGNGILVIRYDYATGRTDEIGYFAWRCVGTSSNGQHGLVDMIVPTDATSPFYTAKVFFDEKAGRLLMSVRSTCNHVNGDYSQWGYCDYESAWVVVIQGFATEFDVLQTYTPVPSTFGFRVPYMPEGLGGVDYFDTYWGALTQPIDFTQANPLQCHYPATLPHVGDYLTVADTLPNPLRGQGYYYVTATHYQGQTRYGRKATGGRLTGRDPSLLPACVQP